MRVAACLGWACAAEVVVGAKVRGLAQLELAVSLYCGQLQDVGCGFYRPLIVRRECRFTCIFRERGSNVPHCAGRCGPPSVVLRPACGFRTIVGKNSEQLCTFSHCFIIVTLAGVKTGTWNWGTLI